MKKISTVLAVLCLITSAFTQSPEKMSYQAVIRDASETLITNTQLVMQISILQGSASGTTVYTESQTPTTNANGLVSIEIGNGTVVNGDFATIEWSNGPYFLKVETDAQGGTNYTIVGTSQLLSVPYAFHAKTAENITGPIPETQNLAHVLAQSNDGDAVQIKNIADPTEAQDAATKKYVDDLKQEIYNELLEAGLNGILTDVEGNTYKTIKIGQQVWMAENLKTTHYADGTPIEEVMGDENWDTLKVSDQAYCWYDEDSATYASTYGALYTWAAAMKGEGSTSTNPSGLQGICPGGWHLPSDEEWKKLEMTLGMSQEEADGAASRGTNQGSQLAGQANLWTDGTLKSDPDFDKSGFAAIPAGLRYKHGKFDVHGSNVYWWSATESNDTETWQRLLYDNSTKVLRYERNKQSGFSVRCVKD